LSDRPEGSLRGNGIHGADALAGAAIDAIIGADDALAILFLDAVHGTFTLAAAAADADSRIDFTGHNAPPSKYRRYLTTISEKFNYIFFPLSPLLRFFAADHASAE
jgi:hypothetical protein